MSISSRHSSSNYMEKVEYHRTNSYVNLTLKTTLRSRYIGDGDITKINGFNIMSSCCHELRTGSYVYFTAGHDGEAILYVRDIREMLIVNSLERVLSESEFSIYN